MVFLSPEKLLVVLVIAFLVLGPDKLPRAARQVGSMWRTMQTLRSRMEAEARSAFPELPLDDLTQAVRSPLGFLDRMTREATREAESSSPPPAAAQPLATTQPPAAASAPTVDSGERAPAGLPAPADFDVSLN